MPTVSPPLVISRGPDFGRLRRTLAVSLESSRVFRSVAVMEKVSDICGTLSTAVGAASPREWDGTTEAQGGAGEAHRRWPEGRSVQGAGKATAVPPGLGLRGLFGLAAAWGGAEGFWPMGQANKLRDCPAVGRGITGVECGRNRGVVYDCPAECPHCPWSPANYGDFLEIDRGIDRKTVAFFLNTVGEREGIRRLQDVANLEGLDDIDPDGEMAVHAASCREFFFRDVEPGRRLFDVWRESGWRGLVKDEPFLAGFGAGVRVALIEVVRVVDGQTVECLDLFGDPGKVLVFCDRGLAASARPFDRYLAWACRYPFFERMLGVAVPIPGAFSDARAEVLDAVGRLGGPAGGEGLADWLGCHFMELAAQIGEDHRVSLRRRLAGSDFKECLAVYRWRDGAVDLGLEGRVDFDLAGPDAGERERLGDHLNYVWLRTGESAKWEDRLPEALRRVPGTPGEPVWGHLLVFPDRVEARAMAGAFFGPMREMVEEFFGGKLEFEREFVADRAKEKWGGDAEEGQGVAVTTNYFRERPADMAAVLKQDFDARMRALMDKGIPALGGLTPREAARSAESRGVLRDWAKGCLSSMESMRESQGLDLGLDWMLEELGLEDLKTARGPVAPARGGWWRVLDSEEASEAMRAAIANAQSPGMELYPEVVEFWQGIGKDLLKRKEKEILVECGDFLVDALVPEGLEPAPVAYNDMVFRVGEVLGDLGYDPGTQPGEGRDHGAFERLLGASVQPALLGRFAELALLMHEETFKGRKVDPEPLFLTLVQLEAFMRAMRQTAL